MSRKEATLPEPVRKSEPAARRAKPAGPPLLLTMKRMPSAEWGAETHRAFKGRLRAVPRDREICS
jgi:hypothetical protein